MKKLKLSEFTKQIIETSNGTIEGGFAIITSKNTTLIIGGEDPIGGVGGDTTTNNCNGGNCASGCGSNTVVGCGGGTNTVPHCGG